MDEYHVPNAEPDGRVRYTGCFAVPPLPPTGDGERGKKEPKARRLTQQALPACKPVLDTVWVVFMYLAIGVVLIPIGAVCVVYGNMPVEVSNRYDLTCFDGFTGNDNNDRQQFIWQNAANPKALTCTFTLTIDKDMPAPVYIFYEINGLNQNNRRYVVSRSDTQLINKANPVTSQCDPEEKYAGNASQIINPCGLTAWTFFNDSYSLSLLQQGAAPAVPITVSTKDMSSASDRAYVFASYYASWFNPFINYLRGGANMTNDQGQEVPVQQNDRFVIWMSLAPLPKFRKLWGIISDRDLVAGDQVQVTAVNRYNTFAYDGQKTFVLSTTTWLGVKNPFLGIVYLVTGCVSVATGFVYFILATWVKPRKLGDVSFLSDSDWAR